MCIGEEKQNIRLLRALRQLYQFLCAGTILLPQTAAFATAKL